MGRNQHIHELFVTTLNSFRRLCQPDPHREARVRLGPLFPLPPFHKVVIMPFVANVRPRDESFSIVVCSLSAGFIAVEQRGAAGPSSEQRCKGHAHSPRAHLQLRRWPMHRDAAMRVRRRRLQCSLKSLMQDVKAYVRRTAI